MTNKDALDEYRTIAKQEYGRLEIAKPKAMSFMEWLLNGKGVEKKLLCSDFEKRMEEHKQVLLKQVRESNHGKHEDLINDFRDIKNKYLAEIKAL